MKKKPVKVELIDSCEKLSLHGFMACMYDRNFSVLVVSGDPTGEQLVEAWEKIFEQYCAITGNYEYEALLDQYIELERLQAKLVVIRSALSVLPFVYSQSLVDDLRAIGYNHPYKWEDQESYMADLKKVATNAQTVSLKINIKVAEIEAEQKKGKSQKKVTKDDFLEGIAHISKYMSFRIDPHYVTVSEYCSYVRTYQKFIEYQKAQHEKTKAQAQIS